MSAIILTWDVDSEVKIITDDNGNPKIFPCTNTAFNWSDDHTNEIDRYMKCVDLYD